jgi:phosphohistidine swiveling domain-containing protein
MSELILWFSEIDEADAARVGGKAHSLGALTGAGFSVPEGFVLTTGALELALGQPALAPLAHDLAALRAKIAELPLPEAVAGELHAAWQKTFRDETPLAVRSSGTKEDLEGASFAGQYETVLNVRGPAELERAVRRCWASMWHERVLEYAARRGGGTDGLSMAVVVQRMIPADVAGVLFTVNPLTGREHESLIEACFGLGEALVSGRVNADSFVVDPTSGRVLKRTIAEKTLRIDPASGPAPGPSNGHYTRETRLVGAAAKAPTLDDAALAELAEIGAAIQEHYGRPMDVEFVRERGQFYVVQARPITKLTFAADVGEWTTADFKDGGVSSDVCSPFMWSLYQLALEHSMPAYFKDIKLLHPDAEDTWGKMFFARPYWNLGAVKQMLEVLPDFEERKFYLDLGIEPAVEGTGKVTKLSVGSLVRALPVLFALKRSYREVLAMAKRFVLRFDERKRPYELTDEQLAALAPGDFASRWRRLIIDLYFETETTYFTTIYNTSNSKTDFNGPFEKAKQACGGDLDYLALVSGLENLSHMRPLAEMHDIAARARAQGGRLDERAVERFVERWKYHGRKELDIRVPRWGEEPELVRGMLEQAIASFDAKNDPVAHARAQRQAYEKERAKALAALKPWQRGAFESGLELVRTYAWWREEVRDHSSYLYYLVRRWSLEAARRLKQRGWIAAVEDVWYLPFQDALELMEGKFEVAEAQRRLRAGRRMVRSFRKFKNPPEIGSRFAGVTSGAIPTGAIVGTGGSPGRVEGTARVLSSIDEMHLVQAGEILVTPFTDPGWTPLFARIAGVVTETGGVLAHAAVISREYGIPAVLAVPGATQRIKNGARIAVDGTLGTIEIVE